MVEITSDGTVFDLDCLDASSTYHALSCTIHFLEIDGYSSVESLPTDILSIIFDKFEEEQIDMSSYTSFPNDAIDRKKCVALLARLQNFGYLGSMMDLAIDQSRLGSRVKENDSDKRTKDIYTAVELVEDALIERSEHKHRYDIGEWVEVRDDSMSWKLSKIENTFEVRGQRVYDTEVDHDLRESEVRWPKEGLRLIFGLGPWIWQQWACLRLENRLRYEEGHEEDFENIDILSYTKELWDIWLTDSRNKSFRALYDRIGTSGQKELLDQ